MEIQKLRVLEVLRAPGGWALVPIHYSHDPEKTTEWIEKERAKYPDETGFARELEIDFGLHSGTPAYPSFRDEKHIVPQLEYDDTLPLLVTMDFNVNPMSMIIAHMENGWLRVFDEIVEGPTTIDSVIQEFRNRYPAHRGDLTFYGDATRGTNAQTAKGNWIVVQTAMRGYSVKPSFRVPFSNPNVGDRLLAVNRKLLGAEGMPGVQIAAKCKELIQDLREVLLSPDQKKILKVYRDDDPYSKRTHASDALGYLIAREWPVIKEQFLVRGTVRRPLRREHLLGDNFGRINTQTVPTRRGGGK